MASRDAEASRLFARICRLQHDQLHLARQEFLAATETLAENLHLMAVAVVAMAADTKELSRATGFSTEQSYEAVLDILRRVADCLLETQDIHLSAGAHLADVCQGIQRGLCPGRGDRTDW